MIVRKATILAVFLLATGLAGGVEARATDPLATEVATQTWSEMSWGEKRHRCDQSQSIGRKRTARKIIRKWNPNATKSGRVQLRKAYGHILNQC